MLNVSISFVLRQARIEIHSVAWGAAAGLVAVTSWAAGLSFARLGVTQGLTPLDLAFLRFVPAALLLAPWFLRHNPGGLTGMGWHKGLVLTFLSGPLFMMAMSAGYQFSPLPHGAVVQPSTVTIATMIGAAIYLGEPLSRAKVRGGVLIVGGLILFSSASLRQDSGFPNSWLGDVFFLVAGLGWAAFTLLLKRWCLSGMQTISVVASLSFIVLLPAAAAFGSFERIAALPWDVVLYQTLVHGALAGAISVIAFGKAVEILGASKAALFPALMPIMTLMIGLPLTGEVPSLFEWIGGGIAIAGLVVALDMLRHRNISSSLARHEKAAP